ncbi:MAG: PLP-dependent aminotransferase family protein [Steroidobacteraceae bacterium]
MDNAPAPAYLRIAADLASLIDGGQLAPAERVPSVRELARQRGVSLTTAVASLRHLEQRGLIVARPQSGFFVARRSPRLEEPRLTRLSRAARRVGIEATIERMREASLDPQVARLGQAVPDPALFPRLQLQRALARTLRESEGVLTDYELRTPGVPLLRQEIVRHYAHIGTSLDADEVLITNGCTDAMSLALRVLLQPGDTLAVESPTYFGFLRLIASLGVKVVEIPSRPRDGLDVDALRRALAAPGGKAIRACLIVSSFNNPSGGSLPEADRRALVRLCDENDLALIEDDVYGDLQFGASRPVPCKQFDREGRVLLCSSFSKTLAPGARIGFVAGGRQTDALRTAKYLTSVATAPLQQEMIANYLRSGHYPRHLARMRRTLAEQVERMTALVERHFPAETRISRPEGGFVLWLELPENLDSLELYDQARRERVDFVPGALFSAAGRYGNCLRLNCGLPVTAGTESAVKRLGALVARSLA